MPFVMVFANYKSSNVYLDAPFCSLDKNHSGNHLSALKRCTIYKKHTNAITRL
jgi:hypothetical protein